MPVEIPYLEPWVHVLEIVLHGYKTLHIIGVPQGKKWQ